MPFLTDYPYFMTECLKSGSFLNQRCSSGSLIGHCCLQLFSRYICVCMKPGYHLLFRDAIVSVYLYASLFWLNGTKRNKARRVEMAARLSCSTASAALLSFNASGAERRACFRSEEQLTHRETVVHKFRYPNTHPKLSCASSLLQTIEPGSA